MINAAIICSIKNVRAHPNADRVQLGTACGYQVVIGLEHKEGDLGIYFPTDTCLGKDYAAENEDILTYFGKNLRVKTQLFRGEKSEGFWAPISTIPDTFAGVDSNLKEGTEVTTYLDCEICKKYINPATLQMKSRGGNIAKNLRSGSLPNFKKHTDTEHLRKEWDKLNKLRPLQWIWTVKVHGTSQRVGYVLVDHDPKFTRTLGTMLNSIRQKIPNRYKIKKPLKPITDFVSRITTKVDSVINNVRHYIGVNDRRWEYLVGTRNVILGEMTANNNPGEDGLEADDFRRSAARPFIGNLHKGEVVYYEVVGYQAFNSPLFTATAKDVKDVKRKYGANITYSYGCANGDFDIYVYRIAYQTEEGVSIDLTWDQVKKRCTELGVKHVPEFELDMSYLQQRKPENMFLDYLQKMIDIPDPIDPTHPMEGVVLRIESSVPKFFKEKSFTFKVLEGIIKDANVVDIEEAS